MGRNCKKEQTNLKSIYNQNPKLTTVISSIKNPKLITIRRNSTRTYLVRWLLMTDEDEASMAMEFDVWVCTPKWNIKELITVVGGNLFLNSMRELGSWVKEKAKDKNKKKQVNMYRSGHMAWTLSTIKLWWL